MMSAAFAELGLDWRYLRLPVPPARFAETVRALPGSGFAGANVTIPHKLAAYELASELTPAARAIGAANTLTFGDGGAISADNTDAGGLLDAIGEPLFGRAALVLGAGGAGRAAVWALREEGADVAVWNRTPERAQALAAELGVRLAAGPLSVDLLVNATSVGLHGEDPEAELPLEDAGLVVDLVYTDRPSRLLAWAEQGGARTVDGLAVLVRQGARSFERWTGQAAPIAAMDAAARSV